MLRDGDDIMWMNAWGLARSAIPGIPALLAIGAIGAAGTLSACVEGVPLPDLIPQARVEYGGRIDLVDATRDDEPALGRCTRIGKASTSTAPSTVEARDGLPGTIDPTVPHSCYVRAKPKALKVDVVESTNDLFQLCLDSKQCKAPDPHKANKTQVCTDADAFGACPVVEVSHDEAARFCAFVGRRLPSGIEHIVIRLAGTRTEDPSVIPGLPGGVAVPATCEDAILRANQCSRPRPVVSEDGAANGAAKNDRVLGTDGTAIQDLMGNVSEWTSDLFPSDRGGADGYPWFCVARLPGSENGFSAANPPTCPSGSACVYAQYKPAADLPLRSDWPVCITSADGHFTGSQGALVGGSYRDEKTDRAHIGIFGRRVEKEPNDVPDTVRAREYGIRCVGDREPDADGNLPDFDDRMELEITP